MVQNHYITATSQWRNGVSNHQQLNFLFNSLFKLMTKKTSKRRILSFVRGIHWWPVVAPHKGPVMWEEFPSHGSINFDSNLTLLLLLRSGRSEGQIQYCLKSRGGLQRREPGSYQDPVVKTTALTTIIFITIGKISNRYPCFHWRVQNVSFAPMLPYTEGDSSRKPRHDCRCHFGFAIEVRLSHVISLIYIDISESGNGNSQVGKPQA